MPNQTDWRVTRARLAAHLRHHPDSDVTELRRDHAAATLAAHIARVVDDAPPLTAEQRDDLAALLAPARIPRSLLTAENGGGPRAA